MPSLLLQRWLGSPTDGRLFSSELGEQVSLHVPSSSPDPEGVSENFKIKAMLHIANSLVAQTDMVSNNVTSHLRLVLFVYERPHPSSAFSTLWLTTCNPDS